MITSARRGVALFALVSLTIVTIAIVMFRSAIYARHADMLAWGFTFDLTLTVPLLYYAIVIRGGSARPISIIPVFVLCVAVAIRIVPHNEQQFLHQLRYVSAPLDLVAMWIVARRLARGSGTGNGVIDRVIASELAILRYGLFAWRKEAPAGFTVHKRSDWGSVVACILVLVGAESLGMHLLIQHWSVRAAWIVTALDFYGVLWVLGDYHALRLRPIIIDDGVLRLRYGLRWSADVPLANIAEIKTAGTRTRSTLKVAILDEPRLWIALREPVTAHGIAGVKKTVDTIAILPDEPERFEAALRLAMCPAATS